MDPIEKQKKSGNLRNPQISLVKGFFGVLQAN